MQKIDILYVILVIVLFFIFIRFIVYPLLFVVLFIFIYIIPVGLNFRSLLIYYAVIKLNFSIYNGKNAKEKLTILNRITHILPLTHGFIDNDGIVIIGKNSLADVENALNDIQREPNGTVKDLFIISHFILLIQFVLFIFLLIAGRFNIGTLLLTALISSGLGYVLGISLSKLFYVKSIQNITFGDVREQPSAKLFSFLGLHSKYNIIKIEVR